MIDYDSRLVDLYDEDNPDGPDHDFYRALADERHAKSVLDLGCGTGILTATLVRDDRTVVGVDPSAGMVTYARRRPGASSVTWILGDSRSIPDVQFDYTVMTGNVVQHILGTDWDRTFAIFAAAWLPAALSLSKAATPPQELGRSGDRVPALRGKRRAAP